MNWVAVVWHCPDSPPLTTLSSGSELVPLEGLRVLRALHGNEAETEKLPGPHQGQLSLLPTSPTPRYDCRALRGCAQGRASVPLLCPAHRASLLCHNLTAPCLQGGGEGDGAIKEKLRHKARPILSRISRPGPGAPGFWAAAAPGREESRD